MQIPADPTRASILPSPLVDYYFAGLGVCHWLTYPEDGVELKVSDARWCADSSPSDAQGWPITLKRFWSLRFSI
jgi:hypothetical protein